MMSHKDPTISSQTKYAYQFTKTKRFPQPNPMYFDFHTAVLKHSTQTTHNSQGAGLPSAMVRRLTSHSFFPKHLLPPATASNPPSRSPKDSPSVAPAKNHRIGHT
jgi:hypothetical protein